MSSWLQAVVQLAEFVVIESELSSSYRNTVKQLVDSVA